MFNKQSLLLSIALLFSIQVSAQKNKTSFFQKLACSRMLSNGQELYNQDKVYDALMVFKQARTKDLFSWKANFWIATAEYDLKNYTSAYENATAALSLTKDKENADLQLILGKSAHRLGNIEVALEHLKTALRVYGPKTAKEYDVPVYISQCEFAINQKREGVENKRKLIVAGFNTKYDEYAPILTGNGQHLYFTARLPETTGENMNPDDDNFFEDIYHAIYNPTKREWELKEETFESVNTEGFDALSHASRNGLYLLGTVNTSASKEKSTTSSEIFELETDVLADYGSPTIIVNKSINTGYYEGAATITDTIIIDEEQETFRQTMIFVSDRNAEKTLTDLYTVEKLNGQWQTAKSLPSFINTPGQETTPFLTPDGKFLFFSSDAMPGMGGYDIYYCEWINNEWSKPINLGATFNTVNDDTHFQIYPEWKKAMMAGIRENEGVFNYDLFEINLEGLDFPFLK
jgi:tetratricopeptide (TPR) repeat protein